jgi:hypothetical protein
MEFHEIGSCMTPEGVTPVGRVRSLTGVLQLAGALLLLWLLLLSGEIMEDTARFSRTLVGVRSKLKARFTCKMVFA